MIEAYLTLISTTALLLGSPGPAPLALAASSATFGIKRAIPFLLGILAGLSVAIITATTGLAVLFDTYPEIRFAVQLVGGLYIIYIAYKIATASVSPEAGVASESTPTFLDGFILNLFNPKAYAAFFAIFSQFLLPYQNEVVGYLATMLVCLFVATIVDIIWLLFGGILRPIFARPKQARFIRVLFALLMLIAVAFALF